MAFNHENLNVYQRMLPFNVKVGIWTGAWDSKHAVCDQLSRKTLLQRVSVMASSMIAGIQR